jgi:hypothetical protein
MDQRRGALVAGGPYDPDVRGGTLVLERCDLD